MPARALVLFAPLLFENDDLLVLAVRNDSGLSRILTGSQQRFELNRAAGIGFDSGNANRLSLLYEKLFAVGSDNCV